MRHHMLKQHPDLAPLALSTISLVLKKRLNLVYKRVASKPLTATTSRVRDHVSEAVKILTFLLHSSAQIIFIDEYNVNPFVSRPYSWCSKGHSTHIIS